MAPNPTQHVYEVIIVDHNGIPYGQITDAVPTKAGKVLDDLGDMTFEAPVLGSGINSIQELLPISAIPGAREVQLWRDNVLWWWGVPVSAAADRSKVTVQCSGLLWFLRNMNFGPPSNFTSGILPEYLSNPQFEDGLTDWTPSVDVTATTQTSTVLLGTTAAQLDTASDGLDAYIEQSIPIDTGPIGQLFVLSGWCYISILGSTAPALGNRGLYIEVRDASNVLVGDPQFAPLDQSAADAAFGNWMFLTTQVELPASVTGWHLKVRLYCPFQEIYWDDCHLIVPQSVGSTTPGGDDWSDIVANVLAYANNPAAGKWAAGLPYDTGSPSTGVVVERHYQFSDNQEIFAAIDEVASTGVCDFEVTWPTEPAIGSPPRQVTLFAPAKGSIQQAEVLETARENFTDLGLNVDGSSSKTAQRVLGQGSSGTAQEFGFASFPCALGGRSVTDGALTAGSTTVTSATIGFVAGDVGKPIYGLLTGALAVGTVITAVGGPTSATMSLPALLTASPTTIGIDGVILDNVASALPNQPVTVLAQAATANLMLTGRPQPIPSVRVAAQDYIDTVQVGDVVPVSVDYGWMQIPPRYMRIVALNLYPVTEELEIVLNDLILPFPPFADPPTVTLRAPSLISGGGA